MRRILFVGLLVGLSGCGYNTWYNPPFTSGTNPNLPQQNSENFQRALGSRAELAPINPEPGNIWPGPLPQSPTLSDLESDSGLTQQPEQPVPGSPLSRGITGPAPTIPETPTHGSSTPPGGGSAVVPPVQLAPPLSSYAAPAAPPPGRGQTGQVVQPPSGTGVTTGGGPGYSTAIQPGGGQSIIVPNGNGTSTVIHADGRIETIPTPK
jgi:hypothetical protein